MRLSSITIISDLVETFKNTSDMYCMASVKKSFLSLMMVAGEAVLKIYLRKGVWDLMLENIPLTTE